MFDSNWVPHTFGLFCEANCSNNNRDERIDRNMKQPGISFLCLAQRNFSAFIFSTLMNGRHIIKYLFSKNQLNALLSLES